MEKMLFEDRGLTEKVTFEQRPEGEEDLGILGEVIQAERTARAKALREKLQEASVAGVQPAAGKNLR